MEDAVLIDPLVGVRAKAIAHGLHKVLGKARSAVTVDVIEGVAQTRHWNTGCGSARNNLRQPGKTTIHLIGEPRVDQQVDELRIGVEGILNALQKTGTDDAAPFQICAIDGMCKL